MFQNRLNGQGAHVGLPFLCSALFGKIEKRSFMASIFSKIIAGEIPSYKIYEDEKTYAFLDINPESKGHTLVVPKVEVDKIYELSDEDWGALWASVKKVAAHMEEVSGRRVVMKVVGTDVPHAHVHLMPMDETWEYGRTLSLTEDEFKEIQAKLAF
jgi:histidine triad (HIT) family protein